MELKKVEKAKELYKLATVITPEDKQQWYNYAGFLSDFGTAAESEAAFFRSGEAIRGTAAVQVSTNCIYAQKIYSKSKAKATAAMRDAIFWKERADKQNEYDKNCIDSYLAGKSSLPKGFHTKH